MRGTVLFVLSILALSAVDARSLRSARPWPQEIPVRIVYETIPIETVYPNVYLKSLEEVKKPGDAPEAVYQAEVVVPAETVVEVVQDTKEQIPAVAIDLLPPEASEVNEANEIENETKVKEEVAEVPKKEELKSEEVEKIEEPEEVKITPTEEEIAQTLRLSESHPAQVPYLKQANPETNEEPQSDAAEDTPTGKPNVEVTTTTTTARPGPLASIQQSVVSAINTIRPSNIVQNLANRLTPTTNAPNGIKVENDAVQSDQSNIFVSMQNGINSQITAFRETLNGAINGLRQNTSNDSPPPARPVLDAIQNTLNNGLNGFASNINNAFNALTQPQAANDQANSTNILQALQSTIQSNINQFGQSISNAFSQQPASTQSDEQPPSPQNSFQAIAGGWNNLVSNVNNIFSQSSLNAPQLNQGGGVGGFFQGLFQQNNNNASSPAPGQLISSFFSNLFQRPTNNAPAAAAAPAAPADPVVPEAPADPEPSADVEQPEDKPTDNIPFKLTSTPSETPSEDVPVKNENNEIKPTDEKPE